MSSHSLLRFAVGSILLGCCVASAQAQRGGAYPMNTGDRINATSGNSDWRVSNEHDGPHQLGVARAYKLN
jgi:hypothetical protein